MTIFLIYMCQLLTLMAFHTTLCEGKCVWHKREEVNKKTNKVVSLPLPPQQTPVHLLLCMSLYPWQVHMSLTPTPQPEQNSQAAGPSQPPTQPTAITPIFLPSLESSEGGGPPKQRALPDGVIPLLSLTHWGLSGTVKGTVLSPFTAAVLNELVEGLY